MLLKIILVTLLAIVIFSLFQALFAMLKNDEAAPKMSKFLGRRLIFSALVVLLLIVLLVTGVITPNPRPY
jgi:branched-subunit amino acid transport protein AzlD|tara:strand:+ start:101 stop:310 length:210 start_codon:yes stop_codon:yes gene_type:complete